MSLITDVDYFRHRLRLAYLRHSDDPYAPRIVSFEPDYASNPTIRAAGLSDSEKWPELNRPESPIPAAHEEVPPPNTRPPLPSLASEVPGKWPGATGLHYTQTIMGNRAGIAGMRVTGRRTSAKGSPFVAGHLVDTRIESIKNEEAPGTPSLSTPHSPTTPVPFHDRHMPSHADLDISRRRSSGGSTIIPGPAALTSMNPPAQDNTQVDPTAGYPPLPAGFRPPRFARGAEMEARRRKRMQMRTPAAIEAARNAARGIVESKGVAKPAPTKPLLTFDDTSDEDEATEEAAAESDTTTESEEVADDTGTMPSDFEEVGFLRPRFDQMNGSDGVSLLSAQLGLSVSQASMNSSLQAPVSDRTRARLSPVAEGHKTGSTAPDTSPSQALKQIAPQSQSHAQHRRPSRTHSKAASGDSTTASPAPLLQPVSSGTTNTVPSSSVLPPSTTMNDGRTSLDPPAPQSRKPSTASSRPPKLPTGSSSTNNSHTLSTRPSVAAFRKRTPQARNVSSALTARLQAKSATSTNPFHYLYAGISGREDSYYMLKVYFPFSQTYKHTPREIRVRKDVSVEEVIGHALWCYCEDKAEPALDEEIPEGMDRKIRMSSAGWCLRIVEEDTDGEVDEDYPVIGRSGGILQWLKHELAVCEAPAVLIKQNIDLDSTIVRRASRLMKSSQAPGQDEEGEALPVVRPRRQEGTGYSDDEILPTPVVHQTGMGDKALLRVRWADYADSAHYWTTLGVTTDTYMADVLDMACRKRRLTGSKEFALLLDDLSIIVPLDRTVESLQERRSLIIMKKTLIDSLGPEFARKPGRSSDPNASIFDNKPPPGKHFSDIMQDSLELSTYKKFVVRRKLPMVFGSHERILAMDGDYIHIIPSATKALLDSLKTSSYHIKTVQECSIPKKDSSAIRLVIQRDDSTKKRYDFEADSHAVAMEIVQIIKTMQKLYHSRRAERPKSTVMARRPRSTVVGLPPE